MKKVSKKLGILLLILAMSLTAFAGCSNNNAGNLNEAPAGGDVSETLTPQTGGEITVAFQEAPEHFDSDNTYAFVTTAVTNHVYEGLFEFNANNEAIPHLAQSYEIIDEGQTYKIILREGVKFSDGEEMIAEDVKASLDRWFDTNAAGIGIKESLMGVEIVNDYEILVKFNKVYAPFLNILASPVSCQKMVVKKKEIIDEFGSSIITTHIGTGPYYFDEIVSGQKVILKRNDHYTPLTSQATGLVGERIAYLDQITIEFVPEENVRVAGLQSGQYDFIDEVSTDRYAEIEAYPDMQPAISEFGTISVLAYNCSRTFENLDLRRAVAYAISPSDMATAQIGDSKFWYAEDGSWFKKGTIWYDAEAGQGVFDNQDIEAAKALVEASDYNGEEIVILGMKANLWSSNGSLALESQLKAIGLNARVDLYDRSTYFDYLKAGDWDIMLSRWSDMSPDPQVFEPWTGTDGWITRWQGEDAQRMDAIFDRMVVELDQSARYEIVKEFYNEFWTSLPYMKIFNDSKVYGIHDSLQGYAGYGQPFFWNVWVK